jgi:hypothetical protein
MYELAVAVNLRPTVSRPVCLGVRRPSGTCDQSFFLLEVSFRHLRVCNVVAPSLTRGRVCKLLCYRVPYKNIQPFAKVKGETELAVMGLVLRKFFFFYDPIFICNL